MLWIQREWLLRRRRVIRFLVGWTVVIFACYSISSHRRAVGRTRAATSNIQWKDERWMSKEYPKSCQKTVFHPFRVGCPQQCARTQNAINATHNESFYRMSIEWYFGQPQHFDHLPTYYSKGINYQCPSMLIDNFINASDRLVSEAQARIPRLQTKRQRRVHMSLMYMCCLRPNETDWAREIMYQWVLDRRPFDLTVRFDKLECWHERLNSVTNIIVTDAPSQQRLMSLNHDLRDRFVQEGIPVEVPREDQMPFHITLAGVQLGQGEGTAEDDISGYLKDIYNIVEPISKEYGDTWAGPNPLRIQHDPRFSTQFAKHA